MFRTLPYTFTTKKPLEVRMGKGKGNHEDWVCPVNKGQILIEFNFLDLPFLEILQILRKCCNRLPIKTKIISNKDKQLSIKLLKIPTELIKIS